MSRIPKASWYSALLIGGAFTTLLWWEHRWPLRRRVEPTRRHIFRNLAVAALSAATVHFAERPVTKPLAALVERRRLGLLKQVTLPAWVEIPLAVALLDYTLYIWHVLTHRVPLLWRLHRPHHVDLDLDTSTALRFHFGEILLSVPWRAAQVVCLGVSQHALSVWQKATLLGIMFHHSNLRLPFTVERWLCHLVVTPRMHGIHHSMVPEETNSNWSSGVLSLWDRWHGTLRLNIPQEAITIGIPAYRQPDEVTLGKTLAMPFAAQRPTWQLPENGQPSRHRLPVPQDQLLD